VVWSLSTNAAAANVSRVPLEPDRHVREIDDLMREVLDGPGVTTRSERMAALDGPGPELTQAYLTKVREHSYRVSDEDFVALRAAGVSEDAIFELTVAAAVGAASRRLDAARRAMRRAP
jgi:alkylhydroperoxidase family enzyme